MNLRTKDLPQILLVDDDEDIRKLMKTYLEMQLFDVLTAANGSEGLSVFQNNDAIRVVVTDRDMPLMNGDTMIREILKINPRVNVILTSANPGYYGQVVRRRTDISLTKPYAPDELAHAVRALLSDPRLDSRDPLEDFKPADAGGAGGEANADIDPGQRRKAKQFTKDRRLQD